MSDDRLLIFPGASPRGSHRLGVADRCLQLYAWTFPEEILYMRHEVGLPLRTKDTKARTAEEVIAELRAYTDAQPDGSDATEIGSLFHLAAAQRYERMRLKSLGQDPEIMYPPLEAVELIAPAKGWSRHLPRVRRTWKLYELEYATERMHVVAVEQLADYTLRGKYRITGRFDLVLEDSNGLIWIWDHKTTAHFKSFLVQAYAVSLQFQTYHWLGRQMYGDRFAGMRLNFVQHGDSPDEVRFERRTAPTYPDRQRLYEDTVEHREETVRQLALKRDIDEWPRANNRGACFAYGRKCPFFDRCNYGV